MSYSVARVRTGQPFADLLPFHAPAGAGTAADAGAAVPTDPSTTAPATAPVAPANRRRDNLLIHDRLLPLRPQRPLMAGLTARLMC